MGIEEKKTELEELEKVIKAHKRSILRSDIMVGIGELFICAILGSRGYNLLVAYLELFAIPTVMIVLGNIMTMRILNREKKKILQKIESLAHEEAEHLKVICEDEDGPDE